MAKITIIGAGSVVFTRNLTSDILLAPDLQDSTIALMDIDPERLEHRSRPGAEDDRRARAARQRRGHARPPRRAGAARTSSSPPSRSAGWRPTTLDIEIPAATASASAWAIRWARAASSAACAPSRCCSTSAATWTNCAPEARCSSTTATPWPSTAGAWPLAAAARTSGCATACRAPQPCSPTSSARPMTRCASGAPASTTRPGSSSSRWNGQDAYPLLRAAIARPRASRQGADPHRR